MNRSMHFVLSTVPALILALGLAPASAHASPDTLRRALENVTQAPVDLLCAPVLAGTALRGNLPEVESSLQRKSYVVPGYLGLLSLQILSAVAREVTGVLQIVPGVALFPFVGRDLGPAWDPFHLGDAWVDWSNPLAEDPAWLKWVPVTTPLTIDVKVGIASPIAPYREPSDAPGPSPKISLEPSETPSPPPTAPPEPGEEPE